MIGKLSALKKNIVAANAVAAATATAIKPFHALRVSRAIGRILLPSLLRSKLDVVLLDRRLAFQARAVKVQLIV
ncbi:MAG: hypothetical protein ACR65T_09935 [Methylocystis sp.]|uniref:hypothetical protein n=1 Tax=Methylocystis sp. TaxID=1911079 RepID=UPI003DA638C5